MVWDWYVISLRVITLPSSAQIALECNVPLGKCKAQCNVQWNQTMYNYLDDSAMQENRMLAGMSWGGKQMILLSEGVLMCLPTLLGLYTYSIRLPFLSKFWRYLYQRSLIIYSRSETHCNRVEQALWALWTRAAKCCWKWRYNLKNIIASKT